MNRDRQYSGNAGSPIKVGYPRIPPRRQTEESTRYNQRRQLPGYADEDENPDAWELAKPHTSTVRYDRPAVPLRRSAMLDDTNPKKTRLIRKRRFDRWAVITWLCMAIIVMAGGWFVFSKIADWWTGVHENMEYGLPFRTSQADQYMDLGDTPDRPDHFIALNLHGVIEVVQLNQRDSKKDVVYVLASIGNDSTPASLSFRDTTGSGHLDVIVTIGDTTPYTVILINNGKTLTPTQPAH